LYLTQKIDWIELASAYRRQETQSSWPVAVRKMCSTSMSTKRMVLKFEMRGVSMWIINIRKISILIKLKRTFLVSNLLFAPRNPASTSSWCIEFKKRDLTNLKLNAVYYPR
jgi:hypothetical protein